jgi:hypothetical protein
MQQPALARAVPIGVGVVVLIAGALQFSAWKARQLARGIRVIEDGFESTAVCRSLVAHDFSPS